MILDVFIPDLDLDFYPSRIPDPGVKKAPDPGSGSATLITPNFLFVICYNSILLAVFCLWWEFRPTW